MMDLIVFWGIREIQAKEGGGSEMHSIPCNHQRVTGCGRELMRLFYNWSPPGLMRGIVVEEMPA